MNYGRPSGGYRSSAATLDPRKLEEILYGAISSFGATSMVYSREACRRLDKKPYYWEREIDIQSELKSRLSTIYSLIGYGEVVAKEQEQLSENMSRTYRFSRVACEPSISYTYSDKKQYRAMTDVVVFDELSNPLEESEHWPILWACEIKYKNYCPSEWDVEKLGYLLEQKRIDFGCWLVFKIDEDLKEPTLSWSKSTHGKRLWICNAMAPSTAGT